MKFNNNQTDLKKTILHECRIRALFFFFLILLLPKGYASGLFSVRPSAWKDPTPGNIVFDTPRSETTDFFLRADPAGGKFIFRTNANTYLRGGLFSPISLPWNTAEVYTRVRINNMTDIRLLSMHFWESLPETYVPAAIYNSLVASRLIPLSNSVLTRLYLTGEYSSTALFTGIKLLSRFGYEYLIPEESGSPLRASVNPYLLFYFTQKDGIAGGFGLLSNVNYKANSFFSLFFSLSMRALYSYGMTDGLPLLPVDNYKGIVPAVEWMYSSVFYGELCLYSERPEFYLYPLASIDKIKLGLFGNLAYFGGFYSCIGGFTRFVVSALESVAYTIDVSGGWDFSAKDTFLTFSFVSRW